MTDYKLLCEQIKSLAEISADETAVLANASALLYDALPDLNWAGFYLVREVPDGPPALILGPFQGKVACVRLERGRGVCGTAWEAGETQLVPDVHAFPGHIACDSASNSEIVVPLRRRAGGIAGVLDLDSPLFSRFTEADRVGLESFARTLEDILSR
jgi:GAF domain-containing protein